jgi:hypothetical protein
MVILVALFSALPAFVATALTTFATPETVRWYAIFVSPGWFVSELFSWHTQRSSGWSDFWFNLPYYFGFVFAFVFWADRRWRRKALCAVCGMESLIVTRLLTPFLEQHP